MIPSNPLDHPVYLNGTLLDTVDLPKLHSSGFKGFDPFEQEALKFIFDWMNGANGFEFSTSGTTGNIKKYWFTREQIEISARKTLAFLNLKGKLNGLVCLNVRYTGGKMALARCLIGGFTIYIHEPSKNPLKLLPPGLPIHLVSFVPAQIIHITEEGSYDQHFSEQSAILIGGAPLSPYREKKLEKLRGRLYQTFGMTETLSHIALRKINEPGRQDYFELLEHITMNTDSTGRLIISVPDLFPEPVYTNDLIRMMDKKRFTWIGRSDHIINSGGIKINLDLLEKEIGDLLGKHNLNNRFILSYLPDETFTNKIIMIIEGNQDEKISDRIYSCMDQSQRPRAFYFMEKFYETGSGKIDREKIIQSVLEQPKAG